MSKPVRGWYIEQTLGIAYSHKDPTPYKDVQEAEQAVSGGKARWSLYGGHLVIELSEQEALKLLEEASIELDCKDEET